MSDSSRKRPPDEEVPILAPRVVQTSRPSPRDTVPDGMRAPRSTPADGNTVRTSRLPGDGMVEGTIVTDDAPTRALPPADARALQRSRAPELAAFGFKTLPDQVAVPAAMLGGPSAPLPARPANAGTPPKGTPTARAMPGATPPPAEPPTRAAPELTEQLLRQLSIDAGQPAPSVARPEAPPAQPQPLGTAAPEPPRTKIWVATHKLPAEPDGRLVFLNEPESPRAAAFRVLRHRLDGARTIAVTSAGPREGKSLCAANLALALGEKGRARVLLLEANLRAPGLAALFGFLPPECFAQQLERHRERPLEPWSMVEVFSPSLHVAAVKPGPENEGRSLTDAVAFRIAIEQLSRAGYDYLVIDTPPVLGSADVNLVEEHADAVLLTGWARRSSARALRRAVAQLTPHKLLGLTLLDE